MRVLVTGSRGLVGSDAIIYFDSKYRLYSWATKSPTAALTILDGRHVILSARSAKRQ